MCMDVCHQKSWLFTVLPLKKRHKYLSTMPCFVISIFRKIPTKSDEYSVKSYYCESVCFSDSNPNLYHSE